MKSIVEIESIFTKDKPLRTALNLLIEYSLSYKTLIFNQDVDGIEFEKLSASQIIKLQSDKYHIADFEVFGHYLYYLHKSKSKIQLCSDFNSFVLLLKEIKAIYKSDKVVRNLTTLFNELWAIAILDANQNLNVDFSDYVKSVDTESNRDDLFSFNEGYSKAMPLLSIAIPNFYYNGIQLIIWTKSDADYNIPRGSFIRGIRNKIKVNEEWGLECYEYSIKQADLEIDFLIPIITGLYNKMGLPFYKKHIEAKNTFKTNSVSVICGLSSIENVKKEECELFFDLYNQVDKENPDVLVNLPKLLFAILRSKEESICKMHIEKSFELLAKLLEIDNGNLICYILRENEFQDNHLELRQELIVNFIKRPHFKQEYLNLINHFLWNIKDVKYFERILYTIGESLPFKPVSKNLSSSINEIRSNYKKDFDKIVVHLLIQDKACYRFVATDLIGDLSSENYSFDYDILELNPLNQYKLWVSMFQRYREPKYILPCLIPLLKSDSPIVKEAFVCKLEEYSENYGSSVTDILKQKLDFTDTDSKAVFERIENYRAEFFEKNVRVKSGIKEINPAFAQNKLFVDYNKNHYRNFNRQLQKTSDENSFFMNLFPKVMLLKGGGWKMDGRDEISKLAEIGSSFSLPRIYFTRPERFDFESSMEMLTDWNENSFNEIIKCLENE